MESIIETFHLDIGLFIAQVVNFFVVVLVLWYFALRPLNNKMNERAISIEKSLEEAEQISKNLLESEEERNKILAESRKESQLILIEAKDQALQVKKDVVEETGEEIKRLVSESKNLIASDRQKMLVDIRKEVSELVMMSLEKVLGKNINAEIDSKIVAESIKEINK